MRLADAIEQVVLEAKYAGYIERQTAQVSSFQRLESKPIPAHFDFTAVPQLRAEAKGKLQRIRPASLSRPRVSGISPPTLPSFCSTSAPQAPDKAPKRPRPHRTVNLLLTPNLPFYETASWY